MAIDAGAGVKPPRLACLLPARNAARDLPAYLASVARCADAVVALDDGSTDDTRELLSMSPLVKILLTNRRRSDYRGWDDAANRSRLLAAAVELDPDWVLFLDADERLDVGDARALRKFLRADAVRGCAYGFQHYRMWGEKRYDLRYNWIYRLFASEPGQRLPRRRLHFNPVPLGIHRRAWVRTTLRIQHFGAADEERLRARRRKYHEADPASHYGRDYAGMDGPPDDVLLTWRKRFAALPVLFAQDGQRRP